MKSCLEDRETDKVTWNKLGSTKDADVSRAKAEIKGESCYCCTTLKLAYRHLFVMEPCKFVDGLAFVFTDAEATLERVKTELSAKDASLEQALLNLQEVKDENEEYKKTVADLQGACEHCRVTALTHIINMYFFRTPS